MQAAAQQILAVYDQAEIRLLEILATTSEEPFRRTWAKRKKAEIADAQRTFREIIAKTSKIGADRGAELIEDAFNGGAQAFLDDARKLGVDVPDTIVPTRLDRMMKLQDELRGKVETVGRAILRDVSDKYRQIVGESLQAGFLHVEDHEQLMQRTLNRFADEGIFGFIDRAGRKWGMGEYTEMATRTGMMHAALEGYAVQAAQYGVDLIIITDHSDECPLCRPWENRVLSLTGAERDNPECTGTLAEAQRAGLFHPNCLHSYNAYVPGLSSKTGGDRQSTARNAEGYNARQTQRGYERQLRRMRRRMVVAMSDESKRKAQARISELEGAIEEIIDKYNTKRRRAREYPYKAVTIKGTEYTL